jgi:PhnB protein
VLALKRVQKKIMQHVDFSAGHSSCKRCANHAGGILCKVSCVPRKQEENFMQVQPYLFFNGRAEEAFAFYRRVLGAEVIDLMRLKDAPEQPPPGAVPPGSENKIMHASLRIGSSTLMASDGHCSGQATFQGFALSLDFPDEQSARKAFEALAEGGNVQMPLGKTFFSPCFGMVADRFGLGWMVIVLPSQ